VISRCYIINTNNELNIIYNNKDFFSDSRWIEIFKTRKRALDLLKNNPNSKEAKILIDKTKIIVNDMRKDWKLD